MQDLKKNLPSSILMLLIFLIGGIYLFSDSMSTYPSFLHAWTQSDRLALAMNFQENGFDFFHPATYNLLTKDGITQVDFPIHDYLIALIGKLFNSDLVFTFRLYNLVYSIIGLFFLFRICLSAGLSGIRSVFLTSFFFTLPFFVYYQNGFLPSVPSFANLLIAIYYLQSYFNKKSQSQLIWSAFFFTLAALARLPFSIFPIAAILLLYWNQVRNKSFKLLEPISLIAGLLVVIAYQLYNKHLGASYGSMFLQELLYINSFENFVYIFETAIDRWKGHILSPFHAILFIALLIAGLKSIYQKNSISSQTIFLAQYFLISGLGVLFFFFAMGNQFVDHDYYYIDSFLPILTILAIVVFRHVNIAKAWYTPTVSICLIFFFYFFSYANGVQKERYTPKWNDRIEYAYSIYQNSAKDLMNWGISANDTVSVLEANSTNIPFTVLKTKGYVSLNSSKDSVISFLKKPSNYVLLIDSFFRLDTYRDYPGIINELELVNSNGQISLYKKDLQDDGPKDFFRKYYYAASFDFDQSGPGYDYYNGIEHVIEKDGNKSMQIDSQIEYTLSYHDTIKDLDLSSPLRIMLVADYFQKEEISKLQIICQLGDYYHAHFTENTLTELDSTVQKAYKWEIPAEKLKDNQQIKVYYWNQSKRSVNIDNYNLIVYQ